jgi:hypothetical protein
MGVGLELKQKRVLVSLYRTMLKIVRDIDGEANLNPPIRRIAGSDKTLAHIATRDQLQDWIRGQFRKSVNVDSKKIIHDAIHGVQQLEQLFQSLQQIEQDEETTTPSSTDAPKTVMEDWQRGIIDEVEWLPSIEEMVSEILKDIPQGSGEVFPMFPLTSTLLEQDIRISTFLHRDVIQSH